MKAALENIRTYRKINEEWATSGQPGPEDFAGIRAAGYEVVVNLALPTSDYALRDEGALVSGQGMLYVHVPVRFDAPEISDFAQFARVMDAFRGRRIWIHCAANMRVSAFLYVYRVACLGVTVEEASKDLGAIWEPDAVWSAWMDRCLEAGVGRSVDVMRAVRYAAEKHRDQRRKDRGATPYINHPIAVAEIMARAGGVTDEVLLQAALLHDTVEDTDATPEEVERLFGAEVRGVVMEVTDDRSLTKAERKRLQVEHAPHMTARAKQIKIADKICNCSDLTVEEPQGWTMERKLEYLEWSERVVAGCRGSNPGLERVFDDLVREKRLLLKGC